MSALRLKPVPLARMGDAIALVTVPSPNPPGPDRLAELRRSNLNPGRLSVWVADACHGSAITPEEAIERWPLARESILGECIGGGR